MDILIILNIFLQISWNNHWKINCVFLRRSSKKQITKKDPWSHGLYSDRAPKVHPPHRSQEKQTASRINTLHSWHRLTVIHPQSFLPGAPTPFTHRTNCRTAFPVRQVLITVTCTELSFIWILEHEKKKKSIKSDIFPNYSTVLELHLHEEHWSPLQHQFLPIYIVFCMIT